MEELFFNFGKLDISLAVIFFRLHINLVNINLTLTQLKKNLIVFIKYLTQSKKFEHGQNIFELADGIGINNSTSRFGKYLQIIFKDGVISGAKLTDYLLEKSRIVTQISEERNYHIFYELLEGLPKEQKDKYGLMSADKYFYLNQGKLKFSH